MINGIFFSYSLPQYCSEVEICDFDRLFSFDSYLLNLSSYLTKMVIFESLKPGLSDCEGMIFVDYIMNTLENSKVRLLFLIHPVQCTQS